MITGVGRLYLSISFPFIRTTWVWTSDRVLEKEWQKQNLILLCVTCLQYMTTTLYTFMTRWKNPSRLSMGALTKNKISCSWKPWYKHYNNFIFLLYIYYIKSQLHVIMKTKPSYTFQHSLLTREVFIMVLGHSQSEEFLIRRVELVTHLYSIISTNIVT